jgi:GntR family transcriptional regulator
MRLWLSKNSEVPLREQLVTQIRLGILSGDLKVKQKLPSTRELARRFSIHSNTVSAAYHELHRHGWVEVRHGSGVYVRARAADQTSGQGHELDEAIGKFFKTARTRGHSLREIQSRLEHWLALQPPDHFLVIEPDPELRQILMTEVQQATGIRVAGAGLDDCGNAEVLTGAVPIGRYSQIEQIRAAVPPDIEIVALRSRSIPESLQAATRPSADALVVIASRWPEFLERARTLLIAAGIDPNALSLRDAREPGWQKGLRSTFTITDSVTHGLLPAGCDARVFRIISDASIAELSNYVEHFFQVHRNSL